MKIYHLSDLHIRAGCNAKARVGEYAFVFARFVAWLRGQDGLDKSMVVITGDLFHHKSRIESPGIKLFYDFLQGLAGVGLGGGVVVIRGNHDYKQWDREDEVDLIGSLMIPGIRGVRYMNETGVEVVEFGGGGGEIELGVLAIQDFSLQGDTVAANRVVPEAMPDFPRPSGERGRKKVALFHGAVPSTLVAARNFFVGYDVALLGDVHAQQVWGEGKRIAAASVGVGAEAEDDQVEGLWAKTIDGFTYGYAGSMIRQNMGEPIKGHGFLVWDLDLGLVTAFHIKNPIEFGDVRALETELQKQMPNLMGMGMGEGKERFERDGDGNGNGNGDGDGVGDGGGEGVGDGKRNPWVEYLLGHGGDETMAGFVLRPETLLLPSVFQGSDNAVIEAKAGERQGKITKRLEAYCDSVGDGVGPAGAGAGPGGSFRLVLARWDWILCYGGGNVFDFGKLDGKINILAARNGHGKTSFLEMILLGLYGTGFPSRTNKLRTASVIGLTKPPKTACQVVLTVRIGSGDLFRITRQFNRQEDAKRLHVNVKATLVEKRNEEGDGWTGYLSGKTAVDKWVVANVGPMSSFLLSCMVSQNADADFFSLSAADQKELLDTAINVESHTRFMELVKESRLAHMAISDLIGATAGVLAKGIWALPDVVGTGERLALLEKWIGEAGSGFGAGGGFWGGGGAGAGAKLEAREFYENIVRGGGAADVADLEKQLAELRTLKTIAARTGGGAKKPLEWYVKELAELDEEPVDDVIKEFDSYDPKAFAAAAAAFEAASDAMPGDLEPDHGFDVGPYNEACACCREKKLECAFLNAARVYAAHIRAKRGYLQGCIATLKTSQLAELEAGLNQARRKQAEFEKAAAILERYDEIVAGQKMTDWLLERQRLRDAVDRRLAMAADMDRWQQMKKVVDERAALFGSIFKIMDGYVAWMYNESVLPRVSKCTNQVMSLIDPALKLRGTVGADGFEWTLATGLGTEDQAPPIEKASGFQRFLCGLAVRIALGGIGAAGVKPRQLFLDEGFTSCDQTNLAKVPEMLQTLLQLYDGIVLVTHLEDLKDAAGDSTIEIKRDEEKGTSRLVF